MFYVFCRRSGERVRVPIGGTQKQKRREHECSPPWMLQAGDLLPLFFIYFFFLLAFFAGFFAAFFAGFLAILISLRGC
jgi:hypothetical protein